HLAAALQIARRLRGEAPSAEAAHSDPSPVVVERDELSRQLETVVVTAWLELSRAGADPLAHVAELSRLGDSVVSGFCDALLKRSLFDPELFYRIGALFEERGHVVRALETYRRVVALDPSFRDAPAKIAALKGRGSGVTREVSTPAPVAASSAIVSGAKPAPK